MPGRIVAANPFAKKFSLPLLIGCVTILGCSRSTEPSTPRETAQATIGTTGGTVVTPSGAAGVQVPAGALTQNAVITITQLSVPSNAGEGPLATNLKQYPPYYEISISPANAQLGDSIRIGVCQVTDPSSEFYPPESDHSRLRLAHNVGGSIEILPLVGVNDFLRCTNITADRSPSSALGRALASISSKGWSLINPKFAYGAHGGLGGKTKSFSPFGAVLDACNNPVAVTIGTTINGSYSGSDCFINALPTDYYTFTLTTQSIVLFTTSGGGSGAAVAMFTLPGPPGVNNRVFDFDFGFKTYAIVPAGTYALYTQGGSAGSRSNYTIGTQVLAGLSGCDDGEIFLTPGAVFGGALTTTDCIGSLPQVYVDHYVASFVAGRSYPIALTATGLNLEICRPTGGNSCTLLQSQVVNSGTGGFTFRPTVTEDLVVNVVSGSIGRTGPYTLSYRVQ